MRAARPDGGTLCGVVHAQIVADLADHDVAGVDSDPYVEVEAALAAQLARVLAKRLLEVQGRVAGALGVVLVRDRRPEQRHDPVAGVLIDGPLEAVHAVGEDLEEAVEDAVPLLRVDPLRQLHRALHVGEQHRDPLALPLEYRARLEDLLDEVLRRVGARVARRRGIGDRLAAARAEPGLRRERGLAARTRALERPTAVHAEARLGGVLLLARRTGQSRRSRWRGPRVAREVRRGPRSRGSRDPGSLAPRSG